MKQNWKFLCFALLALLCISVSAQKFEPLNEIPVGKSVVYIYRPSNFVGALTHYQVHANKQIVSQAFLRNNTYLIFITDPGRYTFWAAGGAMAIDLNVAESGKCYYVRGTCCEFSIPAQERAEEEIKNCKISTYKN